MGKIGLELSLIPLSVNPLGDWSIDTSLLMGSVKILYGPLQLSGQSIVTSWYNCEVSALGLVNSILC